MIKLVYPKFWSKKGILSYLFMPLSWIYQLLGFIRKFFSNPVKFNATVICVGNASIGGTGKTQIVIWLAKFLKEKNINFVVVTKAYGSKLSSAKLVKKNDKAINVGDESILISEFAPVIAAKNISSAIPIIKKQEPEVIIFDDGMQNPGFVKDCNILVFDSGRGIGNGMIIPSGPLRENIVSAVEKSDIITMMGNTPCQDTSLIRAITKSQKPFFKSKMSIVNTLDFSKKYYAFTAIGDPGRFYSLLNEYGINVAETKSFPDHYNYSDKEISVLQKKASENNYYLITTKKDYVKIADNEGIICVNVILNFEDEKNFIELINDELSKKS